MLNKYAERLKNSSIECRKNEPLSLHSTFLIGGNAGLAVFPKTAEQLVFSVREAIALGQRYSVIGNASNVLFSDSGFDGAVIFTSGCKEISIKGNLITAECGASFTHLSSLAAKNSLSGLEFAYGIPGTVGGAVYMNAGAYGGQISDVLVSSTLLDASSGEIKILSAKDQEFGYRTSIYCKNEDLIILSASLELSAGKETEIRERMEELMRQRKEKQPLELPNAGSTFKRPVGYFAGKLIEDAGLKGFSVGGAQISEKHAGFIVNTGGATANDVLRLIEHTKEAVMNKFGVMLECEIKYID